MDTAGCRGCDKKLNAYGQYYCADVACVKRKETEFAAAQREAVRAARAGEVPVLGWEAAPSVLSSCPEDCPDRGMARRGRNTPPEPVCLQPDSECRRQRAAEAWEEAEKRRAAEQQQREAARRAREEERQTYLGRVESYLAHRAASKQKGCSRPEMRLLSLVVLSDYEALDWAGNVLGLPTDF